MVRLCNISIALHRLKQIATNPDYSIHHFELPLVPSATASAAPTEQTPATTHLLVAHMRYIKSDSLDEFRADMAKIGEDEETQRWWKVSAL